MWKLYFSKVTRNQSVCGKKARLAGSTAGWKNVEIKKTYYINSLRTRNGKCDHDSEIDYSHGCGEELAGAIRSKIWLGGSSACGHNSMTLRETKGGRCSYQGDLLRV